MPGAAFMISSRVGMKEPAHKRRLGVSLGGVHGATASIEGLALGDASHMGMSMA
jgi:hypothetical protein